MVLNKKNSNSLFKLIQSTTRTEKIYIKKYLTRFISKEATVTTKLFDLYQKNDNEQDEKFRIKLRLTPPLYANYKYQLYRLILRALSEISKNKSIQSQLLDSLTQIEVLYNKSLFRDALLLIKKTKNLAEKHQEYRLIPQIIQWQMIVMQYISSKETDFTDEKDKLLDQSINYLEIQKNIIAYQQLKKDFQAIRAKYKDNQEKLTSASKKLLDVKIMQNDDEPLSSLAKLHYHQLQYLINLKLDLHLAHEHSSKMIHVLEDELGEEYITHNLSQYVDAHFNILVSASEMKNKDGFINAFSKINELEKKYEKTLNEETAIHIFRSKFLQLAEHFYWFDATEQFINSLPEIKKGIEKYENKIRTIILTRIYFGIGNAFVALGEFDRAIGWYSKTLNYPKESMFGTTYSMTSIMNLICYYETNYIHLSHIIENTKKALKGTISKDSFENKVITYISNNSSNKPSPSKEWPYILWYN